MRRRVRTARVASRALPPLHGGLPALGGRVSGAPHCIELIAISGQWSREKLLGDRIDDRAHRRQQQEGENQPDEEESSLHSRPSLKPKRGLVAVIFSMSTRR